MYIHIVIIFQTFYDRGQWFILNLYSPLIQAFDNDALTSCKETDPVRLSDNAF